MAKIDEVKEILNTLRLFFSIAVGIIVILTGSLINKEKVGDIDIYFWMGSIIDFMSIIGLVLIVKSIKKNTQEIRKLKWVL